MARRDLSTRDFSSQAASELENVISSDKKKTEPSVPTISVDQALNEERVFHGVMKRAVTRVLFVSSDEELLNPAKQTLDGYVNISDLFFSAIC